MKPINHIVLIGRQGSGKSTLSNALVSCGYAKVQSYTTRPPRKGELFSTYPDYHFVSDQQFDKMLPGLSAVRTYETVYGNWRYGINIDDINAPYDTVSILDPDGYLELKNDIENRFAIYIDLDRDLRLMRVFARDNSSNSSEEIMRREDDDAEKFEKFDAIYQDVCELAIRSNRTIEDQVDRILRYVQAFNRGDIQYDEQPDEGDVSIDDEY